MTTADTTSLNLNQIIDNTIEGILLIEDGFIINVNKSLLGILGYEDKEDLIGNLAIGILMPTSKEKYIEFNSKIFQEVSLITKDAITIPAIIKIKDIVINDKDYKMVSVLDMSELRQKENLLIEQSRLAAMGEMISVIAHQWRQPLNAVASITTRLKMKIKMNKLENDLADEKMDEINNYLQYMSKTIDDFRNFFVPNQKRDIVNLNEILEDSLKIINKTLESHNINLQIEKKELKNIYAYKNELIQVILNILNNAKDAFVENDIKERKIIIRFKEDSSSQTIELIDNAGGIPQEILNKIFDPYFSTKLKKNGTGLGLYICKIIIEKYSNGKITAQNINDGAIFSITIDK